MTDYSVAGDLLASLTALYGFSRRVVSGAVRSDSELPLGVGLRFAPCRASGDRVLERADSLAAACCNVALDVEFDDVEAHVVGVIQGHHGFFAEDLCQVVGEKLGFLLSEEKEGGRLIVSALGTDQVGDGCGIPGIAKRELRRVEGWIRQPGADTSSVHIVLSVCLGVMSRSSRFLKHSPCQHGAGEVMRRKLPQALGLATRCQ